MVLPHMALRHTEPTRRNASIVPTLTADQAYERLKQGNKRFVDGNPEGAGRDEARRKLLADGQEPFAIVLCCADSRVVPELTFDAGLGELFVVRVAGNVANTSTIASIEYALAVLKTKLVVVMAHGNCGAIAAAIAGNSPSKNLDYLLGYIQPAIADTDNNDPDAVAQRNAEISAGRLTEQSDIIRHAVGSDGVRVVTAFYHPGTGQTDLAWENRR
jgi:carbonic anhydrase